MNRRKFLQTTLQTAGSLQLAGVLQATGAAALLGLSGCAQNQNLDREQLMIVSDSDLASMSADTWKGISKQEKLSTDPSLRRKVGRVGDRIVRAAGSPDKNWEFHVIESDTVNAFVLPGGQVAFYTGILDIMDNDDQIATVMGHEVGHVVGRHAAERASQKLLAGMGLTIAEVLIGQSGMSNKSQIAAVLGAGVTYGAILPYSRQHEYEADKLGVRFMHGGGYRPKEALTFWERMAAKNQGHSMEFMSTHPADHKRIEAMRLQIQQFGA